MTMMCDGLPSNVLRFSCRQGAPHRLSSKKARSRAPKAVSCKRLLDGTHGLPVDAQSVSIIKCVVIHIAQGIVEPPPYAACVRHNLVAACPILLVEVIRSNLFEHSLIHAFHAGVERLVDITVLVRVADTHFNIEEH